LAAELKISFYKAKKIFIVGPPGCKAKECALQLAEAFNFDFFSVGDLISKEHSKKSSIVNREEG